MKNTFQAPSVTRMKTCNWDNIGGVHKKSKRTMFVSVLRKITVIVPEMETIRKGIEISRQERKKIQDFRTINQTFGGNTCGKVKFLANGSLMVRGKFAKNPLI